MAKQLKITGFLIALVALFFLPASSALAADLAAVQGLTTTSEIPVSAAMWLFGAMLTGFVSLSLRNHG